MTMKLDARLHPAEEHLLEAFAGNPDIHASVAEARAVGLSWQVIVAMMVKYGPLFAQALQDVLEALRTHPPSAAPLPEAEDDEEAPARKGRHTK